MCKSLKNRLKYFIKKYQLKRNGVVIHNNCIFSGVDFQGKAIVEPYCRLVGDPIITIGDDCYVNAGCHFLGEIKIGNDVQIGPKTIIWGRDHGLKREILIREQPHSKKPVCIGDDVWIGANVTILKGVAIGTGAVVGAGSVVVKDIPDYGIAVGNPAKVIKFRD